MERRRQTHYIWLDNVEQLEEELGSNLCIWHPAEHFDFPGYPFYHGEGKSFVANHDGQCLLVNNHYDHLDFMDRDWLAFAATTPYRFWLIQYPALPENGRYSIGDVDFWRGCCAKVLLDNLFRKFIPL